jgi:hypothetical protein
MAAPATVDPTKSAKYPIILSDALLGKASKETYTGIRCKHHSTMDINPALPGMLPPARIPADNDPVCR